jgi:hypothetical protein
LANGCYAAQRTTAAIGRSATIASERERLDGRRSQFDPQQPVAVLKSGHSTDEVKYNRQSRWLELLRLEGAFKTVSCCAADRLCHV